MIAFTCAAILAGRAPKDTPVTVKGWVRTRRDSKAGISFVHVSDGSGFHPVQVVAPNTLANYSDEVMRLTAGCAVEATGAPQHKLASAPSGSICALHTPVSGSTSCTSSAAARSPAIAATTERACSYPVNSRKVGARP